MSETLSEKEYGPPLLFTIEQGLWLNKKETPNFTFLGVKLGVNLVNH